MLSLDTSFYPFQLTIALTFSHRSSVLVLLSFICPFCFLTLSCSLLFYLKPSGFCFLIFLYLSVFLAPSSNFPLIPFLSYSEGRGSQVSVRVFSVKIRKQYWNQTVSPDKKASKEFVATAPYCRHIMFFSLACQGRPIQSELYCHTIQWWLNFLLLVGKQQII